MKSRKINCFIYFSLFFAIAVLLFITGCSGTPPSVPIINSFTADSITIDQGDTVVLNWAVTDATSVTIDQSIGSVALTGSTSLSPTTATTYTLTATNSAGSSTATVTIIVNNTLILQPGPAEGLLLKSRIPIMKIIYIFLSVIYRFL